MQGHPPPPLEHTGTPFLRDAGTPHQGVQGCPLSIGRGKRGLRRPRVSWVRGEQHIPPRLSCPRHRGFQWERGIVGQGQGDSLVPSGCPPQSHTGMMLPRSPGTARPHPGPPGPPCPAGFSPRDLDLLCQLNPPLATKSVLGRMCWSESCRGEEEEQARSCPAGTRGEDLEGSGAYLENTSKSPRREGPAGAEL